MARHGVAWQGEAWQGKARIIITRRKNKMQNINKYGIVYVTKDGGFKFLPTL